MSRSSCHWTAIVEQELKEACDEGDGDTARHFKRIATAIGKIAKVMAYSDRFEAAAMWFRLNREGSAIKRTPPSAIKNRMDQIANAGRKLLWHLEVFNLSETQRASCIIRWPGHIKPGTVLNEMFTALDWVPTFVEIAGGPVARAPGATW